MSIKNHIQVCKKDLQNSDGSIATKPIERLWKAKPKIVIKGVKKLPDDERRSIRILEQSCFVNELSKDEGNYRPTFFHNGLRFDLQEHPLFRSSHFWFLVTFGDK